MHYISNNIFYLWRFLELKTIEIFSSQGDCVRKPQLYLAARFGM